MSLFPVFTSNFLVRVSAGALFGLAAILLGQTAEANPSYSMTDFESFPINIVDTTAKPKVVINASNDHSLYYKAYNDYSDLDGDGVKELTYLHSFDYYGYFDSYKCYVYDDTNKRFKPDTVTTDKYCNVSPQTGQWSGNFLNWASMSRIDAVRKVLFGGHRRVDTSTLTVLERAYLPHDAHSWAKYYDGTDIPKLTPFSMTAADTAFRYNCDSGSLSAAACLTSGTLDKKKVGITIGNTTDIDVSEYGSNDSSEDYINDPPLIKVVKGNYSLWASNERWQLTWKSNSPVGDNHNGTNGNDPTDSGIYAYSSSPDYSTDGIGKKEYVARVVACYTDGTVGTTLLNNEKCKLYPDGNYKPIGLLQTYGDNNEMEFSMVAGSYDNHASGGAIVKAMGIFSDEVNVATDGTFPLVHVNAGGPITNDTKSVGIVNAWSLFKIVGYEGTVNGYYNSTDSCPWGLSKYADVSKANVCRNWGNPFGEMYYQAVHYLANMKVIGAFQDNMSDDLQGLVVPQSLNLDPIGEDSACSQLNIINLNSSAFSYDADEIDSSSEGPHKLWDISGLGVAAMTDEVGLGEGIHNNDFFVGETDVLKGITGTEDDDQLCTPKTITSFGDAGGNCPEGPRLKGSYRVAGLAYYAHTRDIRPDGAGAGRGLDGQQLVDTYSVAMANSLPVLEIADPADSKKTLATIIPACRNQSFSPQGNCAIVDFKIIEQTSTSGSVFIVWEDSEQGGDYDQDMWGTLDYTINTTNKTIAVTTRVISESTPYKMGFGYIIGGTTNDGFHAHSGIEGYTNSETVDAGSSHCNDSNGCNTADNPSTKTYALGESSAKLLEDPLWYASKWGGYTEKDNVPGPNLQSEWDSKINDTGLDGEDGIPDTYFYASNPKKLEDALARVLSAILERTSSGTAAAVVSSNVRGEGALYQAYYEPLKKDGGKEAHWMGTLQALWLDSYGLTREDCSLTGADAATYDPTTATSCPSTPLTCGPANGQLDDYCIDKVVETFYDEDQKRTRVRTFNSSAPDEFVANAMQGVVSSYDTTGGTGALELVPNSMGGMLAWNTTESKFELSPFEIEGKVTAYDATTGVATIDFPTGSWKGKDGDSYQGWAVSVTSSDDLVYPSTDNAFFTEDTITLAVQSGVGIHLTPLDPNLEAVFATTPAGADITLTFKSRDVVGKSGDSFASWDVECIEGVAATGKLYNSSITLANEKTDLISIQDIVGGPFTSCSSAMISSYGMEGTGTYKDWTLSNLTTINGTGLSSTELTVANSGPLSLTVSPTSNWISVNDRIRLSNYSFSTVELYQISYLWNGREKLTALNESNLYNNRSYDAKAGSFGRYIKTWIDADLDGVVDRDASDPQKDEYKPFDRYIVDPAPPAANYSSTLPGTYDQRTYNFFDTNTYADAGKVIEYVRGVEVPGTRSRTIKYVPTDATEGVMRLGDIINSTPTVVGSPQEAFDLLYYDDSYSVFRKKYQGRRVVVYTGGNDGLLHAFNGGFYNIVTSGTSSNVVYTTAGFKNDGTTAATEHDLGDELWAYAPKNLLPHLRWLPDATGYPNSHVYYVDGKPRVFDANIFTEEAACSTSTSSLDCIHPNGWGTVMVVGMNLGGGKILVDADTNQNGSFGAGDTTHEMRSAYLVFDITDPEREPDLLGEIPIPDGSFSAVYPAVAAFRDAKTATPNSWYLMFGNGPDNSSAGIADYASTQTAKMYMFDLRQLVSGTPASPALSGSVTASCTTLTLSQSPFKVAQCDTGVANAFMGTPAVVDWQLNFNADSTYFGTVGDDSATAGSVLRFDFNDTNDPSKWDAMETLFNAYRPVVGQPVPALDNLNRKWIYFGTGRYYIKPDRSSTSEQTLYGIRDDSTAAVATTVTSSNLINVSDVEVYSDGGLVAPLSGAPLSGTVTKFSDLEKQIDTNANVKGWRLKLPLINGVLGTDASTRNTTRSTLLGGVLFSSVFQPSTEPCEGEGESRLYGLYYKTGTAFPDPSVLGSTTVTVGSEVKYISNKYMDLGRGIATSPALHSGTGSGSDTVRVFTQLSTGDIIEATAETITPVRTGKTSWSDRAE